MSANDRPQAIPSVSPELKAWRWLHQGEFDKSWACACGSVHGPAITEPCPACGSERPLGSPELQGRARQRLKAAPQTVPPEPFVDDSVEHFGSVPELKNPPPADGGQEPEIPPTKESLWNENSRLHAVIEELERRLDAVRADLIGVRAQKAAGEPRDWRTDPKVKAKRMDIQDLIVSKDYNTTRDHFQKLDALCEAVATLTASPREKP